MDREILFRGKRIDNGEWVEGYYAVIGKRNVIIALPEMYYTEDAEARYGNEIHDTAPDTVCQYTGLTDRKGKKIFENDKCHVGRPCVFAYGVVRYLEGCFCFVEDGTGNVLRLCDVRINGYEIKVSGSIFDNSTLMKGGAE